MEMIERTGADKMSRIEGRTSGSGSVDYNHKSALLGLHITGVDVELALEAGDPVCTIFRVRDAGSGSVSSFYHEAPLASTKETKNSTHQLADKRARSSLLYSGQAPYGSPPSK